jgi:type IV secretory pathway VirD2 relaxase
VKTRIVTRAESSPSSIRDYLNYIQREGASRDGERGRLYNSTEDSVDRDAFEKSIQDDRHHFRFIVSPEDGQAIADLQGFTRNLMARMQKDLGTELDWVAVDHWDTDDPHTHILLRGKDSNGDDLVIAREYISHGMRERARALATEWLGPRSEMEIRESLQREVARERYTSLDQSLLASQRSGVIDVRPASQHSKPSFHQSLQIGRLQHLKKMGLAQETHSGIWRLDGNLQSTLREMGERGDIIRTMQRALGRSQGDFIVLGREDRNVRLIGRIASQGRVDELYDRRYLIIEGADGRAYHLTLPASSPSKDLPTGAIVELGMPSTPRSVDKNIARFTEDGVYRTRRHLDSISNRPDAEGLVQAHVRRLEALRRAGIVERMEEGVWRIPPDFPVRGLAFDANRDPGATVHVRSHLSLRDQVRALGATWLDQQLLTDEVRPAPNGFGREIRQALAARQSFLVESGFAERRGSNVIYPKPLLATLRDRELEAAAASIHAETGLIPRPMEEGQPFRGVYRASTQLISGRFAMLDDGIGFKLVPWRSAIEKQLGRELTVSVRSGVISWEISRKQDLSR